ncbi:hypothetical protein GCM10008961_32410 [Deinococcus knuensis]|uniref:Uncharacterized protein n=2 Tax=Deinococcus knuensis TaxID=1837380 RepID=A0ABQ2SUN7_9DEIO|nr:hypothetical protein GCM10008961_32410 [Deinococcus knuensis]
MPARQERQHDVPTHELRAAQNQDVHAPILSPMKVRFTPGRVRARIDDLELAALTRGEVLETRVEWPGGGWTLQLDPHTDVLEGRAGSLRAGLLGQLSTLNDPAHEGVTLNGPPRVTVEKDFGPQHG